MKGQLSMRRAACYLLCVLFACLLIFGTTNARFQTTGIGTGSAQAAAVAVAVNSQIDLTSVLKSMKPGEEKRIIFTVNNYSGNGERKVSEVAQEYSITMTTTGNLPLKYQLLLDNGSQDNPDTGSYVDVEHSAEEAFRVIWNGGYLPHSVQTEHTYELIVTWPETENQGSYADEIDLITLTVDAKQAEAKTD